MIKSTGSLRFEFYYIVWLSFIGRWYLRRISPSAIISVASYLITQGLLIELPEIGYLEWHLLLEDFQLVARIIF